MGWAQNRVFETAITGAADARLTAVALGDVDGDEQGRPDIIVTRQSNDVGVLEVELGVPTQIFLDPDTIPVGSFPAALLLDNFDDDEVPDLVVANANSGDVVYLRGLANRDYFDFPADDVPVGDGPRGLASTDLDGDGDLDVVVANEGPSEGVPGTVSILRSNGDGSFNLVRQPDPENPGEVIDGLPAQLATRAVAVGLIDGDELPDILAINTRSSSMTLFRGTATFLFAPGESSAIGAGPEGLVLLDVDGDGELDAVTADSLDDAVSVMLGNGDGTFRERRSYTTGTFPIAVAADDVNGDGEIDIVASNRRSHDVSVLLGDGTGELGPARTYVTEAEPSGVALGDMDDDGDLDVVAIHGGDEGAVALAFNRGDGSYQAVQDLPLGASPSAVASADVDNDSLPDVIVAAEGGTVRVFRAVAGLNFAPATVLQVGGRPASVAVRDLNGDDRVDLAVADRQGRIGIAFGNRQGSFGPLQYVAVTPEPTGIVTGDFNGDGRLDLAVTVITGPPGGVAVALQREDGSFGATGTGGTRVADREFGVGETPIALVSDDFNGDGRDDLVIANEASSNLMMFRSRADGNFDNIQTLSGSQVVGQGPLSMELGDFNRDGATDFALGLAISPAGSPSVRIFTGNGDGTFTFADSVQAGLVISSLVARDFNYDGLVDLVVINQTSNAVSLLAGNGTTRFSVCQTDVAVSRMPVTIAGADFDEDGRYDVATGNNDRSANNVSVIRNCLGDEHCPVPQLDRLCAFTALPIPLRADGNDDGAVTAADIVAASRVVRDVKGTRAAEISIAAVSGFTAASPGVDANGDGRVDYQDRIAVARHIFGS